MGDPRRGVDHLDAEARPALPRVRLGGAALDAPAAAAQRRQEQDQQAQEPHVAHLVPRPGVPARGPAQLPRADGLQPPRRPREVHARRPRGHLRRHPRVGHGAGVRPREAEVAQRRVDPRPHRRRPRGAPRGAPRPSRRRPHARGRDAPRVDVDGPPSRRGRRVRVDRAPLGAPREGAHPHPRGVRRDRRVFLPRRPADLPRGRPRREEAHAGREPRRPRRGPRARGGGRVPRAGARGDPARAGRRDRLEAGRPLRHAGPHRGHGREDLAAPLRDDGGSSAATSPSRASTTRSRPCRPDANAPAPAPLGASVGCAHPHPSRAPTRGAPTGTWTTPDWCSRRRVSRRQGRAAGHVGRGTVACTGPRGPLAVARDPPLPPALCPFRVSPPPPPRRPPVGVPSPSCLCPVGLLSPAPLPPMAHTVEIRRNP